MLHAVDQNDLIVFQDLMDDAIVAAPRAGDRVLPHDEQT
jgi:hypothetical protein